MIRLIRIGGQIMEGNEDFAFWDTVRDRFVEIAGNTVWDSREKFEVDCLFAGGDGERQVCGGFDRLRGFLDNAPWVRATTPDDD